MSRVRTAGRRWLLATACGLIAWPAAAQPTPPAPSRIAAAAVAQRLDDPALVVLHVGTADDYASGHIRGARHVALDLLSSPAAAGALTLEVPPAPALEEALRGLGLRDDSVIVVTYADDWMSQATRVVFTLDYAGLGARTRLLDGGQAAWAAAGLPVTSEAPPTVRPDGTLTVRVRPQALVGFEEMRRLVGSAASAGPRPVIIDARAPDFFTGANDRGGRIPRPGHIPGAVNLPFTAFFDRATPDGPSVLKSREALLAMFAAAGVAPDTPVITYCHIGQQATVPYTVARMLGFDVRLYDGAFEEWSAQTSVPVER